MNFRDWRRLLRVWALPLIGVPAMLLLGYWFEAARFLLFTHHLFWMIGIISLIQPVSETFWPSPASTKSKSKPAPPQPSAKARARREARKLVAKQRPAPTTETPAERLARLQKQKEALDQNIEKLTTKDRGRVK